MAPAQLITRITEHCKDRNFYKPEKFVGPAGLPVISADSIKKPRPVEGEGLNN
jgi:hypothetical protein